MECLGWDEVYEEFENLIKFAARNVYLQQVVADYSIGADDLYQIGMCKLYDCWKRYVNVSMEEFKAVFSVSLFRAVRQSVIQENKTKVLNVTLDHEEYDEGASFGSYEINYEDDIMFKQYIEELREEVKSPIAIAILSELIDPSPRTIFNAWADKARRRKVKSQGKTANIPENAGVKMKHIRDSLGITQKQFDVSIKEIRNAFQYRVLGGVYH